MLQKYHTKKTIMSPFIPVTPDELKIIERHLRKWGRLTIQEHGKPMVSHSHSLLNFALRGARIMGADPRVHWTPEASAIDDLINRLAKYKRQWANAVMHYYTHPGHVRQQAAEMNLPKSTYHERVQKGRHWIANEFRDVD